MTSVIFGQNRFENCRTLIAWQEKPILKIEGELSSLQLDTTGLGEGIKEIRVEGGHVISGDGVRVVISESTVTVFVHNEAILFVTRLESQTLHVKVDLRPLGLNIYDDIVGLHAGRNVIARNMFSGCEVGVRLA